MFNDETNRPWLKQNALFYIFKIKNPPKVEIWSIQLEIWSIQQKYHSFVLFFKTFLCFVVLLWLRYDYVIWFGKLNNFESKTHCWATQTRPYNLNIVNSKQKTTIEYKIVQVREGFHSAITTIIIMITLYAIINLGSVVNESVSISCPMCPQLRSKWGCLASRNTFIA